MGATPELAICPPDVSGKFAVDHSLVYTGDKAKQELEDDENVNLKPDALADLGIYEVDEEKDVDTKEVLPEQSMTTDEPVPNITSQADSAVIRSSEEQPFGGASPEGLPSPPALQPELLGEDDRDSLEETKPDVVPMSKHMMDELGIYEGDEAPTMPHQPPTECDLLGDLHGVPPQQQFTENPYTQQAQYDQYGYLQQQKHPYGYDYPEESTDFTSPDASQYPPVNPFVGIDNAEATNIPQRGSTERDSLEREGSFDPIKSWGMPDGLPAPTPPEEKKKQKSPTTKTTGKPATTGMKKDLNASMTKKPSSAPASKTAKKSVPATPSGAKRTAAATKKENGTSSPTPAAPKRVASAPTPALKKTRPATTASKPPAAPVSHNTTLKQASHNTTLNTSTVRGPGAKRPVGGKAPSVKSTPVIPFYVDMTYVPNSPDVDLDYFRRVRARYYVISSLEPSPQMLDSLLEARKGWGDDEAEVTIIPTYDTEALASWMVNNRDALTTLKVDIAPSAARCTIQLQDHETSCNAYRLEF
jgi:hypothetical protein